MKIIKNKKVITVAIFIIIFIGLATLVGVPKKIGQFVNNKLVSLFTNNQDYLEINRENTPKINVSLNSSKTKATIEITNYPSTATSKQYKTDSSRDWIDYTGEFTIDDNTIIQTRYKNDGDEQYTIGSSRVILDLKYISGIQISLEESAVTTTLTAGGNVKEVTSDGVPIPNGFYYVGGTINEGIVISDNASDENKGTSFATAKTLQGNQFVWVPVSTRKIKTNIESGNEITSIVVKNSTTNNTYNLDVNNQTTYTEDFYPNSDGTYTFTVTDSQGNKATKDITIKNAGSIHWTKTESDGTTHEVGQLWATSYGENFGTKNTGYTANSGLREPDILSYDSYYYDGNTTYLKTALGASTDAQLMSALGLTSLSNKTNNANAFKKILQKEFDQMITSVDKYGGFYVGRYETGGFNTSQCVVKPGQKNGSINSVNWYTMYNKTKTLSTESVTATLIWGCQYDAMCNWIDDPTRTKKSDDTRTSYSTLNTGSIASDVSKNIYDLAGNVWEWTMEAYATSRRVYRGGNYDYARSVSYRNNYGHPYYSSSSSVGGRSALFIL